tara:strand:- start:230 stop:853 length:624 start_codon:yes stop_codon:yes gene_type:complete
MDKELQKRILSSIIILPISLFFIINGSTFFYLFLVILFLIASYEWSKMIKKIEQKVIGIFFLLISFYAVYLTRDKGLMEFFIILTICISTDIGGYVFGKIFKGPKLAKVSPNKTYSGLIGGTLMSILLTYLIVTIYDVNFFEDLNLIFVVFLISSVSQIGDLIISYFKRISNVKDTGKLFPGHGGLLDRIDGMIFAFPFVFIISKTL